MGSGFVAVVSLCTFFLTIRTTIHCFTAAHSLAERALLALRTRSRLIDFTHISTSRLPRDVTSCRICVTCTLSSSCASIRSCADVTVVSLRRCSLRLARSSTTATLFTYAPASSLSLTCTDDVIWSYDVERVDSTSSSCRICAASCSHSLRSDGLDYGWGHILCSRQPIRCHTSATTPHDRTAVVARRPLRSGDTAGCTDGSTGAIRTFDREPTAPTCRHWRVACHSAMCDWLPRRGDVTRRLRIDQRGTIAGCDFSRR